MAAGLGVGFTIKMEPSFEEIEKSLNRLDDVLKRKGLNAGLTAAARPIKRRMKATAPKQAGGGALKRSIGQKALTARAKAAEGIPRDARAIFVGVVRKVSDPKHKRSPGKKIDQAFKALLVTEGTPPHRIPKKGAGRVAIGGQIYSAIDHPGAKRNPFIDRAFQAELPNVDNNYLRGIEKYVNKF